MIPSYRAYLVTNREFNVTLLEKLLPKDITKDMRFRVDSHGGSAGALSGGILARRRRPTALVLDAYTTNEDLIYEQRSWIFPLIRPFTAEARGELFFVRPTTEIVFFQEQALLEHLLNRKFTDLEWYAAQFCPREVLIRVLKDSASGLTIEGLLDQLTDEMVKILRKHPLIQQIIEFFDAKESR